MIKLYTIGCPRCNVLEMKLDRKGVKYEKITDENLMREEGIATLPVLEVENGYRLNYKEAIDYVNLYKENK